MEELLAHIDCDGSGQLDYLEFVAIMTTDPAEEHTSPRQISQKRHQTRLLNLKVAAPCACSSSQHMLGAIKRKGVRDLATVIVNAHDRTQVPWGEAHLRCIGLLIVASPRGAQLLAQAHARKKALDGVMLNPEYRSRLLWRFEQVQTVPWSLLPLSHTGAQGVMAS